MSAAATVLISAALIIWLAPVVALGAAILRGRRDDRAEAKRAEGWS